LLMFEHQDELVNYDPFDWKLVVNGW
jgi:hypothetical protein